MNIKITVKWKNLLFLFTALFLLSSPIRSQSKGIEILSNRLVE